MNEVTEPLHDLVRTLRRERDELRVQLNLAKLDIHDQWRATEARWSHLEEILNETEQDVVDAALKIAREIAEVYRRMRDRVTRADEDT